MAALLVALSVMAVLATAAMPVWHQMTQREKEEELVFRGNQYVRAIRLFTAKAGPGVLPPNLDVLIQQRYLRKKYKDPITSEDFDLLGPVQATAATPGAPTGAGAAAPAGRGGATQPPLVGSTINSTGSGTVATGGRGGAAGGIMGVASKSKAQSIRLYNGRNHYNEWQFLYVAQVQQAGAGGRGQPPGRGQGPQPGIGGPNRGGPPGRPGGPGQTPPTPFGAPGGRQPFPNPGGQPFTVPGTPRPQR
jgi:type II secretory pathway pseudopilin PulG